ncbi:MAG TPA: hypothetical protein VJW76_04980 [Verrucomicrobiae bacterium]|nr:hypothetical protein [Verrucomicrobiae bacterium]
MATSDLSSVPESRAGARPAPSLKQVAPFLVLPGVFLLTALAFARVVGPFYLSYNYDPDYVYLLNGLNLAILQSPEHIDHPGTPLQLALGLSIRLANLGAPAPETAVQVLAHAESYLSAASLVIVLLYAVVMAWVGFAVARSTRIAAAGYLVQATPFLVGDNFLLFLRVNPEPVLLLLTLLMVSALLREDALGPSLGWRQQVLLSFLVATGLCLKITFLPVCALVLLLKRGWKQRLRLGALIIIWGVVWTIPIADKYPRFLGWLWGLATKRGQYGLGPSGFMTLESFFSSLVTLVWTNKFYSFTLLASLAAVVAFRLKAGVDRDRSREHERLLTCLLIGGLLQLAIGAKNPQSRYLIPTMGLLGLNWALIALMAGKFGWLSPAPVRRVALPAGVAVTVVLLVTQQVALFRKTANNAAARMELSRVTTGQEKGARIFYYGASSQIHALTFGTFFSGSQYYGILHRLVDVGDCRTYLLNNWTGEFTSLRHRVQIEDILKDGGPVYLQGDFLSDGEKALLPRSVTIVEVKRFEDERLYEIRPASERPPDSRP